MEYLILIAVLALCVWAGICLSRRHKGRNLIVQMQRERDEATWAAARKVANMLKPRELSQAQQASDDAVERLRIAASTKSVHDYEHACVDMKLAEGDLKYTIANIPAAKKVYDQVTALYTSTIGECTDHPVRALKLYPELAKRIDYIVETVYLSHRGPNLRVIRGGKDTPITQAELDDFTRALYDGRFDAWARDLKP